MDKRVIYSAIKTKIMKKDYKFMNFTNAEQAFETLAEVERLMPNMLEDRNEWNTSHVIHDDPEVWRLWRQIGEIRVCIHKIYACTDPFLHVHPWPSIVKCLSGGYMHTIAMHNGPNSYGEVIRLNPDELDSFSASLTRHTNLVVPGSVYEMTDVRQFHSVKAHDISWSIMLMGMPYFKGATRQFSRVPPQKVELKNYMRNEMFAFADKIYPLV